MVDFSNLLAIKSDADFERIAMEVFHYQLKNCSVYRDYVHLLNRQNLKSIEEIPFLPIEFFKTNEILSCTNHLLEPHILNFSVLFLITLF